MIVSLQIIMIVKFANYYDRTSFIRFARWGHLCDFNIFVLCRPSLSLLSSALQSSKSSSLCGCLGRRWKLVSRMNFPTVADHISLVSEDGFHESFCSYLFVCRWKQSTPAALSRGLGVDFPGRSLKQTTVQPTDPNLAIWKSESDSFSGNPPRLPRLQKCVILLPTFIQSCVKLHLMLHELFKL